MRWSRPDYLPDLVVVHRCPPRQVVMQRNSNVSGRRMVFALLTVALCIVTAAPVARAEPVNVPIKTLGGTQFWADAYVYAGWRIQKNVFTGYFRLLDTQNIRRAWGTLADCRSAFRKIRQRTGLVPRNPHLVLLVPGIARRAGTFDALQAALTEAGYDVAAISYPSTRDSIEAHALQLERLLNRAEGSNSVSFITHSMGALVVRHLLARNGAWKSRLNVHRVVQIAPPNRGSVVAGSLAELDAFRLLFGTAGQQLTPSSATSIPTLSVRFGVIAGGKMDGHGFNPFVPGDDDGVVAVSETRLPGAADFLIVPDMHHRIANNPRTVRAVIRFFQHGTFVR